MLIGQPGAIDLATCTAQLSLTLPSGTFIQHTLTFTGASMTGSTRMGVLGAANCEDDFETTGTKQ
jgi:hypothetical protein